MRVLSNLPTEFLIKIESEIQLNKIGEIINKLELNHLYKDRKNFNNVIEEYKQTVLEHNTCPKNNLHWRLEEVIKFPIFYIKINTFSKLYYNTSRLDDLFMSYSLFIYYYDEFEKEIKKSQKIKNVKNKFNYSLLISTEKEIIINNLIETLNRCNKRHIILTGEPGVGKTFIVQYLEQQISIGNIPILKDYEFHYESLSELVAGSKYVGMFEEKCHKLLNLLRDGKHVIFFDEIHVALGLGRGSDGGIDLANLLKPILTENNDLIFIGATTTNEYSNIKDDAFLRRFRQIEIPEASQKECYFIISNKIQEFNKTNINIENENYLIDNIYEKSLIMKGFNPDKIIDITDIIFAKARVKCITSLSNDLINLYLKEI